MNLALRLKLIFLACLIFATYHSGLLANSDTCSVSLEAQVSHVSCKGISDGSIEIFILENGNWNFNWEDGTNSKNRYGLAPGKYPVKIHSSNCSIDTFFVIQEPTKSIQLMVDEFSNVSCFGMQDGFARVSANGGTSPYEFAFEDNNNYSSADIFNNLGPGEYLVYAKDMNSCEVSLLINISQPDEIFIDIGTEAEISSDEILELDAGDGYAEYLWSTGEITQKIDFVKNVNVRTIETISVEAMDENNCWGKSAPLKVIIHPAITEPEETLIEETIEEQNQIPD